MPKKKRKESASEQAVRFQKEVERLVAAGELSLTEAEVALSALLEGQAAPRQSSD